MALERSHYLLDALPLSLVEHLFDHLPRAPFFVKDASLCYVAANAAMLALCGVGSRGDLIGKTARDFFPSKLSERYETLDREVLASGRPIRERLDLSLRGGVRAEWLLFERWPVMVDGDVVGVAATSRSLEAPDRRHPTYERVALVATRIQREFNTRIRLADLAKEVCISPSQLKRDFVAVFGVAPQRYLQKARIDAALEQLRGGRPIAEVAHACGYSDQSAFTRRFHEAVGITPREYRASCARA